MATIFPRENKDGTTTYRVMFRRKGIKPLITSFTSAIEAIDFVNEFEELYVMNDGNIDYDHLLRKRKNEFARLN